MEYQFPGTFRGLTPLPELDLVTDKVEEEDTGWGTSIAAGFKREYLPLALYNYHQTYETDEAEDPNFNGWDFMKNNLEEFQDIIPLFENAPEWVARAKNETHFRKLATMVREEAQLISEAEANGTIPYLIGSAGAVLFDPLTWCIVGASNKLAQGAKVATTAGRLALYGTLGMGEQAVSELLLHQGQSQRTLLESVSSIAMSGVINAGIGAAFPPKALGKPGIKEVLDNNLEEQGIVIPETMAGREAAGAFYRSKGPTQTLTGGAAPAGVLSKHHGAGWLVNQATPIGRILNLSSDWIHKHRPKYGKTPAGPFADAAIRRHYEVMDKLVEMHMISDQNMKGFATTSATAVKGEYLRAGVSTVTDITEAYAETMKELGQGSTMFSRSWFSGIRRGAFGDDVMRYRLAKEANGGVDPTTAFPLSDKASMLPPVERAKYIAGLKKANKSLDNFYSRMAKDELDYGLLDPKDMHDFYATHRYNLEEIRSDPQGFKNMLYKRFMKRPNEDWLEIEYGTRDWGSLDLETQKVAASHWQSVNRDAMIKRAQNNLNIAAQVLSDKKIEIKDLRKLVTAGGNLRFRRALDVVRQQVQQRRATYEKLALQQQRKAAKLQVFESQLNAWQNTPHPLFMQKSRLIINKVKRLEGLVEGTKRWLRENNKRMAKVNAELTDVDLRLKRAEGFLKSAEIQEGMARRSMKLAVAKAKKAKLVAKKADKVIRTVPTFKTLDEAVDSVYQAVIDRTRSPFGILPVDVVEKSGYMKRRQINWGDMLTDPDLQRYFDLNSERMIMSYTEEMGSKLALTKVFGSDSMDEVLTGSKGVFRMYEDAITEANNAGNKELSNFLQNGYSSARTDVVGLRDMFLGRYNIGEHPNTAILYFSKQLRTFNFNRMMGKVWFSSFTDPATMTAAMDTNLIKFIKAAYRSTRDFDKIPSVELKRLIDGLETSMAYSRQYITWGPDELMTYKGVGTGRTKAITKWIDIGQENISNVMNRANMMTWWNKTMRHVGGNLFIEKSFQEMGDYGKGKLSKYAAGKWARLGITPDMADRIDVLLKTAYNEINGLRYPDINKWINLDPDAAAAWERAMHALLNEGLIMPGLGELPNFASVPLGKVLLQFQSFNFATTARYVRPLIQKGVLDSPLPPLLNAISGILLGYIGYAGRVYLAGANKERWDAQHKKLIENNDVEIIWEAVLRSPLLGPAGVPIEALGKIAGSPINKLIENKYLNGALLPSGAGRLAERSAITTLLGPSIGTFETFSSFGAGLFSMLDPEKSTEEALKRTGRDLSRLAPLMSLWQLQGSAAWARRTGIVKPLVE